MADLTSVTFILPANLVHDAEELGLLTDESVAHWLREALDQRVNEIVNEEIHSYRREKHGLANLPSDVP